jgi:hypothetical protein
VHAGLFQFAINLNFLFPLNTFSNCRNSSIEDDFVSCLVVAFFLNFLTVKEKPTRSLNILQLTYMREQNDEFKIFLSHEHENCACVLNHMPLSLQKSQLQVIVISQCLFCE